MTEGWYGAARAGKAIWGILFDEMGSLQVGSVVERVVGEQRGDQITLLGLFWTKHRSGMELNLSLK